MWPSRTSSRPCPISASGLPAAAQAKLAASAEFVNSAAALPAFQTAYGFTMKPEQLIVLSGGDTAATIKAAAEQTNGANAAMVYGTDGGIAPSGLVVLDDDKSVQPVYAPAPIIREAVLKENPKIADDPEADLPIARSHDPAGSECPRPGGRRGGKVGRGRLPEDEGFREVGAGLRRTVSPRADPALATSTRHKSTSLARDVAGAGLRQARRTGRGNHGNRLACRALRDLSGQPDRWRRAASLARCPAAMGGAGTDGC